jgi:RHS repeat-associated protein
MVAAYTYDAGDRVATRQYRYGVIARYTYDANDRLLTLEHQARGRTFLQFAHDYDAEGNKRFEDKGHASNDSEAYQYDGVYRLIDYKVGALVGATVPAPVTQTGYDLDLLGNWNSRTTDGAVESRTHNAANEITAVGAVPIVHDDNGNLTDDGVRFYDYDEEDRLVRVTRKADSVVLGEYRYDALGRRVSKTDVSSGAETRCFYDGWRVLEEQRASGATLATYAYGNYMDEVLTMDRGGRTLYYHQNAMYSVHALTTLAGTVVEAYRYDAYGRQTVLTPGANGVVDFGGDDVTFAGGVSSVGNPYTFTGQRLDEESGLLYYKKRYYDRDLGGFVSRDPIGYGGGSLALHEYVNGLPTTMVDPLGLLYRGYRSRLARRKPSARTRLSTAAQSGSTAPSTVIPPNTRSDPREVARSRCRTPGSPTKRR